MIKNETPLKMRKSKLTADEIESAEQSADDRKRSRKQGFSLMEIRDRGWARLSNDTVMIWHVDEEKRVPGVPYKYVPKGWFLLHKNGEYIPFDGDEFQKYLRWI